MGTDLFSAVVLSATLIHGKLVVALRLVRIYAHLTLPERELELLNVLASLQAHSEWSTACTAPPDLDAPFSDLGGRPATPLLSDLEDDTWMERVEMFSEQTATLFVRRFVDSCCLRAQCGANATATADAETLQAVYSVELSSAFTRELLSLSGNGRELRLFQCGRAMGVRPWPGDVKSRKGSAIATSPDAIVVQDAASRPDLFFDTTPLTGAFVFDSLRRFGRTDVQVALFRWFCDATLDDFRQADHAGLRAIAASLGLLTRSAAGVDVAFFDVEGLVLNTTERRAAAILDRAFAEQRSTLLYDSSTAICFELWSCLGQSLRLDAVSNIDPTRTVARFDAGAIEGDTLIVCASQQPLVIRFFHFDRHGKYLPVCDTASVHAVLEFPDASVCDSREEWRADATESEAELSSEECESSVDLSGSGDFEADIDVSESHAPADGEVEPFCCPPQSSTLLQVTPPRWQHFSEVLLSDTTQIGLYTLRYFVSDQPSFTLKVRVLDD
jgi:hypothetical protein